MPPTCRAFAPAGCWPSWAALMRVVVDLDGVGFAEAWLSAVEAAQQ
ncbi:MAG TPA: hypothetical protein VFA46_12175 [Actinomycetes bacterium]|nr:hypothetical protein [Actinomycetes bacterium]